jgi:protein gp37
MAQSRLGNIDWTVYHRLKQAGHDPFAPAFHVDVYKRKRDQLANMRQPKRIFISSMGDIGSKGNYLYTGKDNGESYVERHGSNSRIVQNLIIEMAKEIPQHTYQVLTKRPRALWDRVWPDNVHVGVSIDSSGAGFVRVNGLIPIQAATKWVSIEPLLDPGFSTDVLALRMPEDGRPFLRWVVVGGLSKRTGPTPAGCVDAAKRIVEWCAEHMIPCFVKDNMREHDPSYDWPMEFTR